MLSLQIYKIPDEMIFPTSIIYLFFIRLGGKSSQFVVSREPLVSIVQNFTFYSYHKIRRVSLVAQMVKNLPASQETSVQSLG